jgi:uncharacterized protein YbjT (DUF2867 family)
MRIAVAGATGRVGRHVVDVLQETGHDVVAISRSTGVDVITREGLAEALKGVECIVDVATGPSPEQASATEFFLTATRNLQEAAAEAGVGRIVVVSIIGIDQLSGGYNVAKLAHERAMLAGPVPVRILRAAQFHEFIGQMVEWSTRDGVAYLPQARTQPVAARAVAEELAALATDVEWVPSDDEPINQVAGPQEESLPALATALAAHRGDTLRVEGVSNPDDPDSEGYRDGVLLPGPEAKLAGPTFAEWLTS